LFTERDSVQAREVEKYCSRIRFSHRFTRMNTDKNNPCSSV
jgi:hypothetical protein